MNPSGHPPLPALSWRSAAAAAGLLLLLLLPAACATTQPMFAVRHDPLAAKLFHNSVFIDTYADEHYFIAVHRYSPTTSNGGQTPGEGAGEALYIAVMDRAKGPTEASLFATPMADLWLITGWSKPVAADGKERVSFDLSRLDRAPDGSIARETRYRVFLDDACATAVPWQGDTPPPNP